MKQIPVPTHQTLETKDLTFFWNACNTQHSSGDGLAISKNYCRANGFSDSYIKRTLSPYLEFDSEFSFDEKRPGTGVCKKAHLTPQGVELFAQLEKFRRASEERVYAHVKNSRKGLVIENIFKKDVVLTHNITPSKKGIKTLLASKEKGDADWARLTKRMLNQDGSIDIHYHRESGDRYYAMGYTPQIMPKRVRDTLFSDYKSYDMEACHYAILSSMFPEMKAIKEYAFNKKKIREAIVEESGLEIKQVKKYITAIMYGMNAFKHEEQLNNSKTFKEINKEVKQAQKQIQCGSIGTGKPSVFLHHLLCTVESMVMDVVMDHVDVRLLVHDGFLTKENLDVEWLTQLVEEKMGLRVLWEKA